MFEGATQTTTPAAVSQAVARSLPGSNRSPDIAAAITRLPTSGVTQPRVATTRSPLCRTPIQTTHSAEIETAPAAVARAVFCA